jgi:predicted nucleic acid-binding protein
VIVVDTTALVYAVGTAHPLKEPCRALIRAVTDGRIEATTTVEVIQEFIHVRARRRGRRDAAKRGRELARLFRPLLIPGDAELALGLELFEQHEQLGAFDAVLAAAAKLAGADALVSADRAFSAIAGIKHLDPGRPELARLLGGKSTDDRPPSGEGEPSSEASM